MQEKKTFQIFNLDKKLLHIINKNQFIYPTPIQIQTIPYFLQGKDLFALAKTGSGKTGAFLIPALQKILHLKQAHSPSANATIFSPYYLIVVPTRELAIQIKTVLDNFAQALNIKSLLIIGGESVQKQKKNASEFFDILVATPGRLLDLYDQKIFHFRETRGIILDEVDRLFDMGFKKDIRKIFSYLPKNRQVLMFSATTNIEVLQTAYHFHSLPIEIKIESDSLLVKQIVHSIYHVTDNEKIQLLVGILKRLVTKDHVLIFCNDQVQTHLLFEWLTSLNFTTAALHGTLSQSKRNSIVQEFRSKKISILISTDISSRGLDIDDISLVINYDLPQDPSNYVHRIGRTCRLNRSGEAISFCSFRDCPSLEQIETFLNEKIPIKILDESLLYTHLGKKPKYKTKKELSKIQQITKPQPKVITPMKQYTKRPPHTPRISNKFFKIIATNFSAAEAQAMNYFPVNATEHLKVNILEKKRKTFLFFGSQKITYEFSVKPEYEYYADIFLDDLIKHMNFDLQFHIKMNKNHLQITFEGPDKPLLKKDHNDLLYAFEHCLKKYLGNFIMLDRSFKISMDHIINHDQKISIDENKIKIFADTMKKEVVKTRRYLITKSLSPNERRIIHEYFDKDKTINTISIGSGRFKKIKIDLYK